MMASSREHSEHDIVRLPPDEERSIVHQALTDHYRNTLDEPIQRSAANAAQGGQDCERPEEGDRVAEDAGEPISAAASRGSDGAYDFTWLWRELGVGDERR